MTDKLLANAAATCQGEECAKVSQYVQKQSAQLGCPKVGSCPDQSTLNEYWRVSQAKAQGLEPVYPESWLLDGKAVLDLGKWGVRALATSTGKGSLETLEVLGRTPVWNVTAGGANAGTAITNDVLVETRIGNGTKGQGSGNKLDQLPNQQIVGADGKPIPIYEVKPNGPYATREFPSTPVAHGFPDIVDNYASSATKFQLNNGASLYQAAGTYNGVAGRFEWIVDPKLGGVTQDVCAKWFG